MPYALVPSVRIRTKRQWKDLGFTVEKEYPLWVHAGHGLIINDMGQFTTIYRGNVRRIKRKKDFLWTFIKRRMK